MAKATPKRADLLKRITTNLEIFGGKPIVRGHRLAVEHVPQMPPTINCVYNCINQYTLVSSNEDQHRNRR
jgi:hypothetical protein